MDMIYVDLDKLRDALGVYSRCRQDLESMLNELNSGIEKLKNHWKGDVEKTFSSVHFPQLCEKIKKHMDKIQFLEGELKESLNEFQSLESEIKSNLG